MYINTSIHLDGLPVLSIKKGGNFAWMSLSDTRDHITDVQIFFPVDMREEERFRRAVEAFNSAINEQPVAEAAE